MLVQETIQPLLRFFNPNVSADTDTPVVSIANAQAVRIVAHTGTITGTGTAALQVRVNRTSSTQDSVGVPGKAITQLASNRSYEIFVSGAEAYTALWRSAFLFVRLTVPNTLTVPIVIEISAFPGRDVPSPLPSDWVRIL